jgi:hypothetical protein
MMLLCAITNSIIAVIIYILLVKVANDNKTPRSYMDNEVYNKSLELFILISVFLSFFVNKLLINTCI